MARTLHGPRSDGARHPRYASLTDAQLHVLAFDGSFEVRTGARKELRKRSHPKKKHNQLITMRNDADPTVRSAARNEINLRDSHFTGTHGIE